jgi:hypothetical protein
MKFFIFIFTILSWSQIKAEDLMTLAHRSGWKHTGRAIETELLCKNFQKKFPKFISCRTYGKTPEGRNLLYVIVGDRQPQNPVIWVQAGIHAGEIDGKDAVFWLLKNILENKIKTNPLQGVTMIFIPIVNVDGHERFGKWNRPNQNGPVEMGWRTTAQNYNLNRDFMKADAPEMQALIKLWRNSDPIVSMDLHVTDGADFRPEVGIMVTPNQLHGNSALHIAGSSLEAGMIDKLKQKGHLALPFYPSFQEEDRPLTGFSRSVSTPRFSDGYWFSQNRIGVLVESHSWKDYATRVRTHYNAVLSALEIVKKYGEEWNKSAVQLDREDLSGKHVTLSFKHTNKSTLIDFPGYKFQISASPISGKEVIRYFPNQPEIWKVPFYNEIVPDVTVKAPQEGYFVPAAHAKGIIEKLNLHGIKWQNFNDAKEQSVEVFRATKKEFSPHSFEGHQTLTVDGKWANETVTLTKGSIFIPIKQKKAYLVMQLLEPLAKDSFLSWGFFNTAFEPKEYMENYVAEDVAKEMLKDPKIKTEFNERLKDQSFANDPGKRYEFFYKKHPSWDTKLDMYPLYRK